MSELVRFGISIPAAIRDIADTMASADTRNRSNFIAWLIEEEHARRQQPAHTLTDAPGSEYNVTVHHETGTEEPPND